MPETAEVKDMETERQARRGHTPKTRTVDYLVQMEAIRNRLGMTKADFSIGLGYVTNGGYDAATKANGATLQLLLAAEGLERRRKKIDAGPVVYALLAIHPDGKVVSTAIGGSPQTANIMGQDYLLIPKN